MTPGSDPPPRIERRKSVPDGEDWPDRRHDVLGRLEDLKETDAAQTAQLTRIETALAVLQTKVTLYAAGVALVVSALVELAVGLIKR